MQGSPWGALQPQGQPPSRPPLPVPKALGAKGSGQAQASLGRVAARTGGWSVVGDLYCEIVRTLSTNWNLKFQRGETEGPYPRVEMALGFFPPRLLFFVLISPAFCCTAPRVAGGGGRLGDSGVLSSEGRPGAGSLAARCLDGAVGPAVPRDSATRQPLPGTGPGPADNGAACRR